MRLTAGYFALAFMASVVAAQTSNPPVVPKVPAAIPAAIADNSNIGEYRIGQDDVLEITVFEMPELHSTVRVDSQGLLTMPMVGALSVADKTSMQIKSEIESALKGKYIKNPHAQVFVREYGSQPISVLGPVSSPGIYQIKGQKSLLEVIAMAHGFSTNVGGQVRIIRQGRTNADGTPVSEPITVNIDELREGRSAANVAIIAHDIIQVEDAPSIFVVGEVTRPGEFPIRNAKSLSVSQALALGGGFRQGAKRKECLVIRYRQDGSREEIKLNIQKILEGSADDRLMMPNDILFVPADKVASGAGKALESAISIALSRVIF